MGEITETKVLDWSNKINEQENVVLTTNSASGMQSLKVTLNLSEEDKNQLREFTNQYAFSGKKFVYEMCEDPTNFKYENGKIVFSNMDINSNVFQEAEQLALSFIRYDE